MYFVLPLPFSLHLNYMKYVLFSRSGHGLYYVLSWPWDKGRLGKPWHCGGVWQQFQSLDIYLIPKQRKMSYHPRYLNHCMPQTKARKYSTMTLCVNSAKREILPKLLQFCIQIRRIPVTPFQSDFCTWKQSAYVVSWTNFLIYDRRGYLPKS